MKKKLSLLCLPLLVMALSGCKKPAVVEEAPPPDYTHITWQMDDVSTTTESKMEDGAFYVEHTEEDGSKTYYELGTPASSENNRYFLTDNENTPTLFLGQGDKLIYHSYTKLLQNIYLSRLEDMGYTIGIYDISQLENGRCVLRADGDHVLPLCTDAEVLRSQEAETILIDEMGIALPSGYQFGTPEEGTKTITLNENTLTFYDGLTAVTTRSLEDYNAEQFDPKSPDINAIRYPKLTADTLKRGILYGLEKEQSYHLEFYSGTYYGTADLMANIHIFHLKEYFHTNRYQVRQGVLFEVELPTVCDGVYTVGTNLGQGGTFRLINDSYYSIEDTFEEFVLPSGVYGTASESNDYNQIRLLSDIEEASIVAGMDAEYYQNAYFCYETEPETNRKDNGFSWYYQKDDIILGRILNRHEQFFAEKDKPVLSTVTELPDGRLIIRYFGCEREDITIPEYTSDIFVEFFSEADILFITEAGISLLPREQNTGVIVVNATLSIAEELPLETPEVSTEEAQTEVSDILPEETPEVTE